MTDAGLDPLDDYVRINRANWNSRVPVHATGYDLDRFRTEPDFLSGVVRFDVPRLGDVGGLDAVHLQCHIGTDTLSLARLGARMTGLDFSAPALDVGRQLAAACGTAIDYVCAEVYNAIEVLGGERFDLVYTSIGALCWLPDVRRWADVVAGCSARVVGCTCAKATPWCGRCATRGPTGCSSWSTRTSRPRGTLFSEPKTYVEHEGDIASPDSVGFNHGLGQIITTLQDAGMTFTSLKEHMSVPWNVAGDAMVEDELGEWSLRDQPERLAGTYTLQASKPS